MENIIVFISFFTRRIAKRKMSKLREEMSLSCEKHYCFHKFFYEKNYERKMSELREEIIVRCEKYCCFISSLRKELRKKNE